MVLYMLWEGVTPVIPSIYESWHTLFASAVYACVLIVLIGVLAWLLILTMSIGSEVMLVIAPEVG